MNNTKPTHISIGGPLCTIVVELDHLIATTKKTEMCFPNGIVDVSPPNFPGFQLFHPFGGRYSLSLWLNFSAVSRPRTSRQRPLLAVPQDEHQLGTRKILVNLDYGLRSRRSVSTSSYGGSWNGLTFKSAILMEFFIINHSFWIRHFGKPPDLQILNSVWNHQSVMALATPLRQMARDHLENPAWMAS